MENYYSISIPKPCHEDWNTMSPKEKGRFCDSCAKTVIDFTKMDSFEIQDFISKNKNNRICGHFKQIQLDSINLHIPSKFLEQKKSFHKLFLLALLIAMGTSLMNCTNKNGNKQKIDSVEVVDTINDKIIDVLGGLPVIEKLDSIQKKECKMNSKDDIVDIVVDGELIIETLVGDIDIIETERIPAEIDSINIPLPPTVGLIETKPTRCPTSDKEPEEEIVMGFIQVESPPEFKNTPQTISAKEKREYFSKQISSIVSKNFNTSVCLDLTGKQRVYTQFKIDSLGFVKDIKTRAHHPKLEEEAKRTIKLLPQFIPAKQKGKPVSIVYNLPIFFQIEE